MIEPPSVLVTRELLYAGIRQVIPVAEIQKVMHPTIQEVLAAIAAQGLVPQGPFFTHHFHRPMQTFDFEVCFPVARPIDAEGRVNPGVWPATKVARTVYHGSYSGLPGAWGELEKWLAANGHKPGTEFWERYVVGPDSAPDPAAWRTELNWPVLDE